MKWFFIPTIVLCLLINLACNRHTSEAQSMQDRERGNSDTTELVFIDSALKQATFLYEKKHCLSIRCTEQDTVISLCYGMYRRKGDSVFVHCPDWETETYRRIKSRHFLVTYDSARYFNGERYVPCMSYMNTIVPDPEDLVQTLFHVRGDRPRTIQVFVGYNHDTLLIEGNKIREL